MRRWWFLRLCFAGRFEGAGERVRKLQDVVLASEGSGAKMVGMENERVLYLKSGCPWCTEVIDYLKRKGIAVKMVNVSGDREAMAEMVNLSGQSKAPTLDWDGEVLADFGVDELVPFLKGKL